MSKKKGTKSAGHWQRENYQGADFSQRRKTASRDYGKLARGGDPKSWKRN